MSTYDMIVDQIDVYQGIANSNEGALSEAQCKHLRELIFTIKPFGEPAEKWIALGNELLDQQKLNCLMVANNCGKLPKMVVKQLKQVSNLTWRYDTSAHCYVADLNNYEEAKFISMKIIAIISGDYPDCYCSYVNLAKNKTLFFWDKLNGYRPSN
ncbi:MAG: hypothetical protein SNH27_16410 [Rikenellaceae bacterium]